MQVKISDFSGGLREDKSEHLRGFSFAKNLENVAVASGSIKTVSSLEELMIKNRHIDRILATVGKALDFSGGQIFFFKKYNDTTECDENKIVFLDSSLEVYYINLSDSNPRAYELGISFSSVPSAINYKLNGEDVLIMASKTDNMVVWNGVDAPEIILDAPKISSMDLHYERLFAISSEGDGCTLSFSDDLDPTNWSESLSDAGFINFSDERGKLLKVISFNDYLYLFRERGITRVYANTAIQSSFYVNHLFVSGGRINPDTISVCGDRIIFLATDGFYVFDGAETKKLLNGVFLGLDITGEEKAIFFNGVYYLLCNKQGERVILAVTISDGSVSVIKYYNPQAFAVVVDNNESFLAVLNAEGINQIYKLVEAPSENQIGLKSVYVSVPYDFGDPTSRKVIKRVKIKTKNPKFIKVSFTIKNEQDQSVSFSFSGDKDQRLMFSGREFSYEISFSGEVEIESVEFEV